MSATAGGRPSRLALATAASIVLALLLCAPAKAAFGLLPGAEGFDLTARELDGSIDDQAATHPYTLTTTVAFDRQGAFSDGDVRSIDIARPSGLIENPAAVSQCSVAQFNTPRSSPFQQSLSGESCPNASQIGTVAVRSSLGPVRTFGVFNLTPSPGFPAAIGASPFGMPIVFRAGIDSSAGEYRLSLRAENISQQLSISDLTMTFWGNPWLVGHDRERGNCLNEEDPADYFGTDAVLEREPQTKPETPPFYEPGTCSVGNPKAYPPVAYLTLPTACSGPMVSTATVTSWQQPAPPSRVSLSHDEAGQPLPLLGCDPRSVEREGASVVPTSDRASSATGLDFRIDRNQDPLLFNFTPTGRLIPGIRAPSQIRKAVVKMPEGMTINPSVAAGLGVCSPAGYEAETAISAPGAGCPNADKIGEVSVETPLFAAPIAGSLFIASPYDNPFGTLLALYLVAKDPARGVVIKLAGRVDADPASGRLVATFDQLPQLPYSRFSVRFREGQRSPLATPAACGSYTTQIDLSPWLDPGLSFGNTVPFQLNAGIGGAPCPSGPAPFTPQAAGGTMNRNAGSYSPFYLHLTRGDGEQEITSYSATLPPGLLGRIAVVPFCPEAAIEAAKRNSGFAETEHPSCPEASKIGHTTAGYGLGNVLAYAPGNLYLAGPYHGSPLSVVAVDSATVGPFDLGVIIVRSAIRVDPLTAQLSIDSSGSDPIPHILDGIPLHLRDIRVYMDRPNLMVNPTSCERFTLGSTLSGSGADFASSADDTTASVGDPFQVSFCSSLDFKPRIELRMKGGTRRGQYPSLVATVTPRPGEANIGTAQVTLPPTIFLAQNHIDAICGRSQSAAGKCPPGSIYGQARALTPLMDEPLEGPVYLRASDNKLPDLVAQLTGRGVRVDVVGRIDSRNGGMRASYETLPDAPVSKFVLTLDGGRKHGLLVNSDNTCKGATGLARMSGQNNLGVVLKPAVVNSKCNRKAKKRKHSQVKRKARK